MISVDAAYSSIPPQPSLEEGLKDKVCRELEEDVSSSWDDFLSPNEGNPQNMAPLLAQMGYGVYVGPGTQRIMFAAGLADPRRCIGIVGLDVNQNVKKVNEVSILFFRLSASREDLIQLARLPKNEQDKTSKLKEIDAKIVKDDLIPPFMKDYYRKNLQNYVGFYYKSEMNCWTDDPQLYKGSAHLWGPSFNQVNYFKHDSVFQKIREYAIAGKIVSIVGNINDLSLLNGYPIGIVDISTIY